MSCELWNVSPLSYTAEGWPQPSRVKPPLFKVALVVFCELSNPQPEEAIFVSRVKAGRTDRLTAGLQELLELLDMSQETLAYRVDQVTAIPKLGLKYTVPTFETLQPPTQ